MITTIAITSNTSAFTNITITATDTIASYYLHHYIFALNLAINGTANSSTNTTTTAQSSLLTVLFTRNISIYSSSNNKYNNIITTTTITYQHYYQYYQYYFALPPPLRLFLHFHLISLPMLLFYSLLPTLGSDPPYM